MNAFRLILIVLVAGAIGLVGYQLGLSQGVATTVPLAPGIAPVAYYAPFHFFGFGFLGLLFPILFLFLIFGLGRALFWSGRWGGPGYRHGYWGDPQARLEEWHKAAHGETPTERKGS